MDNGEVIPGLNEDWTFCGAKAMEWISGFVMTMMISELIIQKNIGRYVPLLLMVLIGTTLAMAAWRKEFPDEERGVRNHLMVMLGLPPPGIPTPAALQPIWSGAPVRKLKEGARFAYLGLNELFASKDENGEDVPPYSDELVQ